MDMSTLEIKHQFQHSSNALHGIYTFLRRASYLDRGSEHERAVTHGR